jgi:hypothetical protein
MDMKDCKRYLPSVDMTLQLLSQYDNESIKQILYLRYEM